MTIAETRHIGTTMRIPSLADGKHLYRLARESNGLELNSPYSYLLICRHFAETSLIALNGPTPVGFISGHRPPKADNVVFVWQIGVAASYHGQGIGGAMLDALVRLPGCRGVKYLEATVTPSNEASRRMFRGVARRLGARCEETACFPRSLFPAGDHEEEDLFRIGPFRLLDLG